MTAPSIFKDFTVVERFHRKDRVYVRISDGTNSLTMPQANYVWLCGNPTFLEIPKGYVVHHLDHDKMNDDISNLVIMYKHHHHAHHLKDQHNVVPVNFHPEVKDHIAFDSPIVRPTFTYLKDRGFFVMIYRRSSDKTPRKQIRVYKVMGKRIMSQDQGEALIDKIWPDAPWNDADNY